MLTIATAMARKLGLEVSPTLALSGAEARWNRALASTKLSDWASGSTPGEKKKKTKKEPARMLRPAVGYDAFFDMVLEVPACPSVFVSGYFFSLVGKPDDVGADPGRLYGYGADCGQGEPRIRHRSGI